MPRGLPGDVEHALARQPIPPERKLRWQAQAGYARVGGGVFVRTPSREALVGGSRTYALLQWLEPQLRCESSLDEIVRPLPADGARTISELVAHLVRVGAVGAVGDAVEAAATAAPAAAPGPPESFPRALPLRGRGQLLAGLRALMAGAPTTAAEPVLWVYDHPDRERDRRLRRRLAGAGAPWLPVRADLGEIWVGPLSGRWAGCATCLDLRRRAGHRYGLARERIGRRLAAQPDPRLAEPGVARAIARAALAWDLRDARTAVAIRGPEGTAEAVPVLPVPGCPACGHLDDRRVTAWRLDVDADAGAADGRASGLRTIGARLERAAVGRRTGVIHSVVSPPGEALPGLRVGQASVSTGDPVRERRTSGEWASGVAEGPEEARALAMLEALERYAATKPRGHRLERARGADLGSRAIDPRRLVLHGDEQYRRRGFRWAPYDAGAVRWWSWAYSVSGDRQVAVPADLVFHQMSRASPDGCPRVAPLAYTTSNGSAIGGSLAEAAYHGLLEVVERDAFLAAWYAAQELPRLRLETAEDPRIGRLRRMLSAAGYESIALDVSRPELRVPSVWALAVNTGDSGLKTLSGACSHPDPEVAVLGALREVAGHLPAMRELYERERGRAEAMLADPAMVRSPVDHALVHGCPRAFDRIEPLIGPHSPDPLQTHFGAGVGRRLDSLCSRLKDGGFDVLLVDMTPADVAELGLSVVRAMVPGALPITFGHGRERLAGTDRVPAGSSERWLHPLA